MIDFAGALKANMPVKEKNSSPAPARAAAKSDSTSATSTKAPEKRFSDVLDSKPDVSSAQSNANTPSIDDKSETKPKSESSPAESPQQAKSTKTATRQAAMEIFLDRMENEVGVEPSDVLESFSKLSMSEMMAPPEESADKIISQLGLDDKKSQKAMGLYNEMLAMTAAAGMSQYLTNKGQEAQFQVMDKKEVELRNLRSSIGQMSDKFFMTGGFSPNTGIDQQAKITDAAAMNSQMQNPALTNDSAKTLNTEDQNQQNENFDQAETTASLGVSSSLDTAAPQTKLPLDGMSAAPQGESVLPQNFQQFNDVQDSPDEITNDQLDDAIKSNVKTKVAQPKGNETVAAASVPQVNQPVTTQAAQPVEAAAVNPLHAMGMGNHSGPAADGSKDDGTDSDKSDGSPIDIRAGQQIGTEKIGHNKDFVVAAPKATAADVQNNIKDIISQAQFLAKKGGGEMKVSLNPDGMGQVSLKVKSVKGQVSVEMVTSSEEAKKLLEKGLSELKDNLAVHKLHLDSIKIDSSKDISNQLSQQKQDLEQGFQQKFLSDFKDQNQGFKREMFEFGAPRMPESQSRDQDPNAKYAAAYKRKSDSSRRLDLVA
jgi:flagellar hook-length control protein FliK